MERETTVLTTPASKQKVKVYTYLTGRESEYCQAPLLEAMSLEGTGKDAKVGGLSVTAIQASTHRLIEKQVLSVGDVTEGIVDLVLDMRNDDYQWIVEQLQDLAKKN